MPHSQSLDEITFKATPSGLELESYIDEDAPRSKQMLLTHCMFRTSDLQTYKLDTEEGFEVTFCVKELKAIIAFCEAADSNCELLFECVPSPSYNVKFSISQLSALSTVYLFASGTGDPVILSTSPSTYTLDMVLATLQKDDIPLTSEGMPPFNVSHPFVSFFSLFS